MAASRVFTFGRTVLLAGILLSLAVAFGPLVREAWARARWERVPCYNFPDSDRFLFRYHNKMWTAARPNMWYAPRTDPVPAASADFPLEPNTHCYVDGSDPPLAVLRLDASRHLAAGAGNFAAAAALLAASVGLAAMSARKRTSVQHPAPPPAA
jgi:hypothetical protein